LLKFQTLDPRWRATLPTLDAISTKLFCRFLSALNENRQAADTMRYYLSRSVAHISERQGEQTPVFRGYRFKSFFDDSATNAVNASGVVCENPFQMKHKD
jgi:hypothetical protein